MVVVRENECLWASRKHSQVSRNPPFLLLVLLGTATGSTTTTASTSTSTETSTVSHSASPFKSVSFSPFLGSTLCSEKQRYCLTLLLVL